MINTAIETPFQIFTDIDGSPLENGYIYIGEVNKNPEVNSVTVYIDEALTTPLAQPIRTLGGYATLNGTPINFYTDGDFSITIRDKNETLVFSESQSTDFLSQTLEKYVYNVDTISDMLLLDTNVFNTVNVKGYYAANDGGGGMFNYDASQSAVNNGGTVINGWVRQVLSTVTVKEFGAKGDESNDDTEAIQNAMDWAAANSIKLMVTNGNYKTTDQILTSTNLTMEWVTGAWIKPYEFSQVGAVLTNVVPGSILDSLQDNIVIINPQFDLDNLPYETATSNDNAIGFARQATNVKIIGGYIKNVRPVWSTGIGGTGGKGVNFEHGAYNCAVEGTITFENCYTGLYLNGLMGDASGYNKGVSTVSVDNIIAINCDSAVTVGSLDATQVTDKDPFWNSYTINSIVFRNCGYSVSKDLTEETTKLFQKAGAINITGARNLTINSITGWNESDYAPYSTITDPNNIGYGLTDNIGAVIWGHGHNVSINHVTFNGNADSLLHIGMCYSVGDSNPPDNRVLSMDDFYINNAIIYNSILQIVEADEYHIPFTETLNANIKVKMGKDSTDASFCDSYLENQYTTLTLDVVNKAGFKVHGAVGRLQALIGTTDNVEYDISDVWLDGTLAHIKSIPLDKDTFKKIPFYGDSGVMTINSIGYLTRSMLGFRFTAGGTTIEKLDAVSLHIEVGIGVPTGTTGTDNRVTLYVDEATNAIYIENRVGTDRFNVSFL